MYNLLVILLSTFVLTLRSPIHSILSLCAVYLISGIYLVLLDLNFFAFSLIIVYIGAIAILFIFTVFILNLRTMDSNRNFWVFLIPLPFLIDDTNEFYSIVSKDWTSINFIDIKVLGIYLYEIYPMISIMISVMLLIVLIGVVKVHIKN